MSKRLEIPPIKANPRIGKATPTDASVAWGGARLPKTSKGSKVSKPPGVAKTSKGKKRRTPQTKLTLPDEALEALREVMAIYGQTASMITGQALIEYRAIVKKRLE